ncbi:MAG: pyruvate, phosphate dikinase [Planctomycetes bacterium]|nr:pyruvate, phosphate dikinase [Planctomycetota bacterium]
MVRGRGLGPRNPEPLARAGRKTGSARARGPRSQNVANIDPRLTTGLDGLDRMLKGLIRGDNIVWQVGRVEQYRSFVQAYQQAARKIGEPLIYLRFAGHEPFLQAEPGTRIHTLDPNDAFEGFVTSIHRIIEETGRGGYYVFDCLSELAGAWRSDQMLGNFFMLTCPYLYDVEAIAYFCVLRGQHSFHATRAIAETTQVFLDVYEHDRRLYVHPWKVQARHSPTMHMLHARTGDDFVPVSDSATTTEVRHSVPWLQSETLQAGLWNQTFTRAADLGRDDLDRGRFGPQRAECFESLLRMCVSRDEQMIRLARRYFTLEDIVEIGKRMVGTGLIGGKSVGMLLARAILRAADGRWGRLLEPHDSFFIGSDVFYTYLVRNGIWALRERARDADRYLEGSERARQRMLIGTFPESVNQQFEDMLDYFGQSPVIVRSSSLLEDNFGNAFAGKYESVFCANQGSRHQRLEDFLAAVRTIYASTMSEKALTYRAQRGLLDRDEQMALLVQRVSGSMHGNLFFPEVAGVAFSVNPYVWNRQIDPSAGMLRIVYGMGTRAVDRADDDYTRVVALDAPTRRPEETFSEIRRCSQRKVDVLDLTANQLVSVRFQEMLAGPYDVSVDLLTSADAEASRAAAGTAGAAAPPRVLTYEKLFTQTDFVKDMRAMLSSLHKAYDYPVDVEFTTNFLQDGYRINVVQCRPLQVTGGGRVSKPPADLPADRVLLDARQAVIGQARVSRVDRIVYVVPQRYALLPIARRYSVARLIGRACHVEPRGRRRILLVGPGRWGTTTPSLGVPVRFSEIDSVSAVCEVVAMGEGVAPDVSLGTHFFSDMIEVDMLYFALFPQQPGNVLGDGLLAAAPNRLDDLVPNGEDLADVIRIIDADAAWPGRAVVLHANPLDQRAVCYLADPQEVRER